MSFQLHGACARIAPVAALAAGLLGTLAAPATAHDSAKFMVSRQAPIPGQVIVGPSFATSFDSQGIALLGWLPLPEFGGASGADCWGYTSGSGREYAIMTTSASIAFVEVTDPGRPVIVANLPAVSSLWRDVKVYQTFAYWVSEGGDGVQIADLSQIDNGIVTPLGGVFDSGTSGTHNVAIDTDSGFLYRLGGGSDPNEGLRIFSLANPAAPVFVGAWNDRYVHDAQIVRFTSGPFAGQEIAFCFADDLSGGGSPGLDILNVTNKANITKIGAAFYGSSAFSHQGWLTPDRQTLYLNDELDEQFFGTPTTTRILDVSDLTDPQAIGTFTSGKASIDHNLYTKGNLIFESNYRSGLRVFDATNPTSPVQTAWFDTYPGDDAPEFNGLWSVYPYFDSGTIVGSDLERGLFVWRLGDRELDFAIAGGAPGLLAPNGASFDVTITAQGGASLDGTTARLHVDCGSGFDEFPLADLGGGSFRVAFPAIPCGTPVEWYLSARTTGGVTWTEPPAGPGFVYGSSSALAETVVVETDMESTTGWSVSAPGDTATTGIWTRVDPLGTSAQPDEDHSPAGSLCFVTGQGSPFGSVGENDVDDGQTTLTTTSFDLSGGDAVVSYWRWYSNVAGGEPQADVFAVDLSNDGGSSWTSVEVVGPAGEQTFGGWYQHSFQVSELLPPTGAMRLRFVASDLGDGSIVEAAVDDLRVVRFECGIQWSGTPAEISVSSGGAQTMELVAGAEFQNELFWVFGSASGTTPGFAGLPLNFDGYFNFTLTSPNSLIANSLGLMGPGGNATSVLTLPAGTSGTLAGLTLHHAAIGFTFGGAALFTSEAIEVDLQP